MTRLGIVVVGLAVLGWAGCSKDEGAAGAEQAVDDEVRTAAAPQEPAAGEQPGAAPGESEEQPLWVRMRQGDDRIPIRAVAIDLGKTQDRVLFFREKVSCEGIPRTEDAEQADDTIVVAAGVEPVPAELMGQLHPTKWWWEHRPQKVRPADEWQIELEEPAGDKDEVGGEVEIRTSEESDYAFELEGKFSAIVCGPESS